MKKYWWEFTQAVEFADGSCVMEKGMYQACNISEVLDTIFDHNEKRNDCFVGVKVLGVKITGLEM